MDLEKDLTPAAEQPAAPAESPKASPAPAVEPAAAAPTAQKQSLHRLPPRQNRLPHVRQRLVRLLLLPNQPTTSLSPKWWPRLTCTNVWLP